MTDSVGLAVSIASGLVKLGARADLIVAEEIAVRSELGLGSRKMVVAPEAATMKRALQSLLDEEIVGADPLEEHRGELAALVAQDDPDAAQMLSWLQRLAPESLELKLDDPQGRYRRALEERREAWNLDDADIRAAVFFLGPEDELRKQNLAWQLGLAVVDVLAEFALENQQWIVREERARPVVAAVLERGRGSSGTSCARRSTVCSTRARRWAATRCGSRVCSRPWPTRARPATRATST
jgi:hypothetical protein